MNYNYVPGSYGYQPAIGGYAQNGPAVYSQPMQTVQPVQPIPTPPSNGIIWVQGEEGAKAYMVAAGNSVLLMDSEGSSFYIKSTDQSGMPQPLRVFDYVERNTQKLPPRVVETPAQPAPEIDLSRFVTREEFDYLQSQLNAITAATAEKQETNKQENRDNKNYNHK